jgi:hypothetical protein
MLPASTLSGNGGGLLCMRSCHEAAGEAQLTVAGTCRPRKYQVPAVTVTGGSTLNPTSATRVAI